MKKPKKVKLHHLKDGEPHEIAFGNDSLHWDICCDCGLIHIERYYMKKGRLFRRVWRDDHATEMYRRETRRDRKGARGG